MTAEEHGDHSASFVLLSPESRQDFKNVSQWARRRTELAPITAFSLDRNAAKNGEVVATVEHHPGLDPFIGLSAARERQTWRVRKEDGGYLVDAEPDVEPVLPADDAAKPAAVAWAQAVQTCDEGKAKSHQGIDTLYGQSTVAVALCPSSGAVTAGVVEKLTPGPASSDIVAQYGTDALQWARSVAITGPSGAFHVIVAPIGDQWMAIGLAD